MKNRLLVIIFVIWACIHVFAHFVHPIEGIPNALTEVIYDISLVVPLLLLLLLFLNKVANGIKLPTIINKVVNSEKVWLWLFGVAFIVIVIFVIWTQLLGHYICYRGLMTTAGLLVLLAIWLFKKYKDRIGIWQAAFVGMLGAGFAFGFWEIIYQAAGYILRWGDWMGTSNFTIVIMEQLSFVIPFLLACIIYKIRPNRGTMFYFLLFVIFWGVWIVVFDYWSIVTFVDVNGIMTAIQTEPIKWDVYYLIKLGQVAMICSVMTLGFKKEKIPADFDWKAFDSLNPIQRLWKKSMAQNIWDITNNADSSVLDIGCGSSRIITQYKNAIGIDIDGDKIIYMAKKTNGKFLSMNCYNLEFCNNSFGIVMCIEVIEHLGEPDKMLSEASRVLDKGGLFIIATPDTSKILWNITQWFYNIFGGYKGDHITFYNLNSLKKAVEKHGLSFVEHRYIMGCDLLCVFKKYE